MSNLSALLKAEALLAIRSDDSNLADSKLREAESICRATLDTRRRVLGENHQATLATQNNLARILQEKGEYAAAERLDRKTILVLRRRLGDNHRNTLDAMSSLRMMPSRPGRGCLRAKTTVRPSAATSGERGIGVTYRHDSVRFRDGLPNININMKILKLLLTPFYNFRNRWRYEKRIRELKKNDPFLY